MTSEVRYELNLTSLCLVSSISNVLVSVSPLDETNSVIQVVKGQTTVTLAGLLANTRYVIQVAASNRKGRGPLSPKKTCVTTEAPPEAPGEKST